VETKPSQDSILTAQKRKVFEQGGVAPIPHDSVKAMWVRTCIIFIIKLYTVGCI
jgi:hypothetical protein